jgi:4-amino-4-deoxy-L-arabinose transferase-like glycosyltransferase
MKPSMLTGLDPAPAGFDGKWLSIRLFSLATALPLPVDDLISSRLATASIGITTGLALFLLARDLFSPGAGLLSVALFVVLPFTLIYSSTALTDGIQLAFSSWASFLAVRLARSRHWSYSITLPLILAAAILAKFSAILLVPLPVLAIVLLTPRKQWAGAFLRAVPALLMPLGC